MPDQNGNGDKPNFYTLYQNVGEIKGILSEVKCKIDKVAENHENRLNSCEKDINTMVGKATMLGLIGGAIMGAISLFVAWFKK